MRKYFILFFTILIFQVSLAHSNELNIYNWSDFIHSDIIKQFENETGIKIKYDVYDSNYTLESKIMVTDTGYDLVFPDASPFLIRQLQADIYQKIDKSKLKNYKNIDPLFLDILSGADPSLEYSIPYLWNSIGIGYNVSEAKKRLPGEKIDSLKYFLDERYLSKFKDCGIGMFNEVYNLFPLVSIYYNKPHNESSTLNTIKNCLKKIRPLIMNIDEAIYANDLASGDACIVLGPSGDIMQSKDRAREANNGIEIQYTLPKEGSVIVMTVMAIPKYAKNVENAHKFIDFLLRPEIISKISLFTGFLTPNKESYKLLPQEVIMDKNLYPEEDIIKNLYLVEPSTPEYSRKRTRAWLNILTDK